MEMKPVKKSKFLVFCLSWIPGAGEMYMGFMRMGLSIMMVAGSLLTISAMLELGFLIFFAIVAWFYGFFHANHLASLSDAEFAKVADDYLFGMETVARGKENVERYRKGLAYFLILAGVIMLWNVGIRWVIDILPDDLRGLAWNISHRIPQVVIGILIIFGGVKMIQGRKKDLFEEGGESSFQSDNAGKTEGEA